MKYRIIPVYILIALISFSINLNAASMNVALIAQESTVERAYDVFVSSNYLYVADYSGLLIMDVTDPSNPIQYPYYPLFGSIVAVEVENERAYLCTTLGGMWIVDVTEPNTPTVIGQYLDSDSFYRDICIKEPLAYLANDNDGLAIVDVSVPETPTLVSTLDTPGAALGIFIVDQYAYIADRLSGLRIIDISNPDTPTEVGHHSTVSEANSVFVSNDTAYVSDNFGICIIDVSNPTNPIEIGFIGSIGAVERVYVEDKYAYAAISNSMIFGDYGELRVFDISIPDTPVEVGFYDDMQFSCHGVDLSGENIFVGATSSGVYILDFLSENVPVSIRGTITNEEIPVANIMVNLSGDSSASTVTDIDGNYTFTNLIAGATYIITPSKKYYVFTPENVTFIDLHENVIQNFTETKDFAVNLENVLVYPNPWKADIGVDYVTFDKLTEGAKIQIFTISGDHVFETTTDSIVYFWDLNNSHAEVIATGIYIYHISTNEGERAMGKFAIVR